MACTKPQNEKCPVERCRDCDYYTVISSNNEAKDTESPPPTGQTEFALLNAISDVLGGMIADAKGKHDSGEWPKKFLHAHEGIGLMQAVEVIEKLRKEYGI